MKLLLDTHAFIWWDSTPDKIPAATLLHLEKPENVVVVSLASLWEIQIKTQLGKLALRTDLAEVLRQQQIENSTGLFHFQRSELEFTQSPFHRSSHGIIYTNGAFCGADE